MRITFGTDGIRGPVSGFMTPETCLRIGYAVGSVMSAEGINTVLIGKDTRVSGYMLESALQSGLISSGINVVLLGPIPTPGVAFLTRSLRNQFGIVISASHNSYEDNGIKIFDEQGEKISRSREKKIEKFLSQDLTVVESSSLGKAKRLNDAAARYIEFCKSTVPLSVNFNNLRIVLDCANGASYKVTPTIFEELGAEVIKIGTSPDGYNINENCGSTNPDLIKKEVIKQRADFGVALDGDGDRVTLIDEDGNILDGDDLLFILGYCNPNRSGPWKGIVGTVMSNFGLEEGLNNLGYDFKRADVGDKNISNILNQKKWYLGGEPSGHIISKDLISTGDGTIAALKVIASILLSKKKPKEILQKINKRPQITKSESLLNKSLIKNKKFNEFIKSIEQDLMVSRVIVRESGTEPKVRITVESEQIETAQKYTMDIVTFLKELDS